MKVFYFKVGELVLFALITVFCLYGAKISEVLYYKRGIFILFVGFLLLTVQSLLSIINYLGDLWIYLINLFGLGLVLSGLIVLTWFRKKLGL